jgi:uncharacterized protein
MTELDTLKFLIAATAAVILGISKAGIGSLSILTVSFLAYVFGSRVSTGILLPMLSFADVLAVIYYHRHTQWKHLYRLLPWMMLGILLGVWIGADLDEGLFKKIMTTFVMIAVVSMVWFEGNPNRKIPTHWTFSGTMGLAAGFTTMVGNLAGAFSNIYFLSVRLPKDQFIGTGAWLFLLVNAFKIPFHIWVWHTITPQSVGINLKLLPFLIVGFFVGVRIVRNIDEARYRKLILWLTALASVVILLSI